MTNEEAFESWWAVVGVSVIADPKKTVKGVARRAFLAALDPNVIGDVVGTTGVDFALDPVVKSFSKYVVDLWNTIVTAPIPKARWSADRGKKIDTRRTALPTLDHWRVAITEMNATDWCRGEAKNSEHPNWKATLTWFVKKDDTVLRFLEAATAKRVTRATTRVANCRHTPPCRTSEQCSDKYLETIG